eukprot:9297689-Lingulodinium_polyedra.AAC.1
MRADAVAARAEFAPRWHGAQGLGVQGVGGSFRRGEDGRARASGVAPHCQCLPERLVLAAAAAGAL